MKKRKKDFRCRQRKTPSRSFFFFFYSFSKELTGENSVATPVVEAKMYVLNLNVGFPVILILPLSLLMVHFNEYISDRFSFPRFKQPLRGHHVNHINLLLFVFQTLFVRVPIFIAITFFLSLYSDWF